MVLLKMMMYLRTPRISGGFPSVLHIGNTVSVLVTCRKWLTGYRIRETHTFLLFLTIEGNLPLLPTAILGHNDPRKVEQTPLDLRLSLLLVRSITQIRHRTCFEISLHAKSSRFYDLSSNRK